MTVDAYPLLFTESLPPLARLTLGRRLVETLARKHVSVVGHSNFGKSVLVHHVANLARARGIFSDVVVWDLRHFMPEEDAAFFQRFASVLAGGLTACGKDATDCLADPAYQTVSGVKEVLDWLSESKQCALLVMDGLDGPLSCPGLSKNVWDNLCAFADKGSLRFLAASRQRLRTLCRNPQSRTSDFFRRFDDPPTTLAAFNPEELNDFLEPLAHTRPLAKGTAAEFARQTGGIPLLSVALARKIALSEGNNGPLAAEEVRAAAGALLAEDGDVLPEVWRSTGAEEQAAYAELLQQPETIRPELHAVAERLVKLGLATREGRNIRAGCELIRSYSEDQHGSLLSVRQLFAKVENYHKHLPEVVQWRFQQLTVANESLRDFVRSAVDSTARPKVCMTKIRGIVDQMLAMIWRVEAPDGQTPKFESDRAASKYGPLPTDAAGLIDRLRLLMDPRNGVTPKKSTVQLYCLVNALKGYGDLGQHQRDLEIPPAFASVVCLTAIEATEELIATGIDGLVK